MILFLFSVADAISQDQQFTQFYAVPTSISPAFADPAHPTAAPGTTGYRETDVADPGCLPGYFG